MGLKILYPETLSSVASTSAEVDYPVENLEDDKIRKVWRAVSGVSPVTVTVTTSGNDDCVAMFGIVADSAVVTVKDSLGATVTTSSFNLANGDSRAYGRFWIEYTAQVAGHDITIVLTKASGQIEAGVVRTGTMIDLSKNPKWGIAEGRKDQSIVKELSNGSLYVRRREVQRTYSTQLLITRANFYELTDLYDTNGPQPLAMLLIDGDEDRQWSIFGHMNQPVEGSHDYPSYTNCTVPILEAI